MEKKIDKNINFSSFSNNEILSDLEKDNHNIKENPFDPILNLTKIEDIIYNINSNTQDILYFLFFNMYNIETILYNIDEIIYFDFDEKNNNYFLKINQEKKEINNKNEMILLFYISLLIKYNQNLVNFSFSIILIYKIHSINTIDESNIYKNLLISKVILELIDYYKSNQIFEVKNYKEEEKKLNEIEKQNNKIIEKYINNFEIIGLKITQKDLKLKNIDLIYAEIINILLKSKDYESAHKIINQLGLENINITKTMFNEISKTLSPNGSYINEYNLITFDDLLDSKKIDFYYILFKFILKNSIYIYYIEFLNEARKTIIMNLKQNQLKNYNFNDKAIYIIKFFTKSENEAKYFNLNDNGLNSKLNTDNETNKNSTNPLENPSFEKEKEKSQRGGSSFGLNMQTSQNIDESKEENRSNKNKIRNEAINNPSNSKNSRDLTIH